MVKKGTKPEIKTAEKPELVSAEVEESADEVIQQDFKFCVKTHKKKILMFQMELVAVSKEFCEIKNNVKDDNLKLFEGKVLALEEQVCSIYLITLDNVEQCGDELEARAERLLDWMTPEPYQGHVVLCLIIAINLDQNLVRLFQRERI